MRACGAIIPCGMSSRSSRTAPAIPGGSTTTSTASSSSPPASSRISTTSFPAGAISGRPGSISIPTPTRTSRPSPTTRTTRADIRDNAHWGERHSADRVRRQRRHQRRRRRPRALRPRHLPEQTTSRRRIAAQLIFGNLHGHRLVQDYIDPQGQHLHRQARADFMRSNDMDFIPVTAEGRPRWRALRQRLERQTGLPSRQQCRGACGTGATGGSIASVMMPRAQGVTASCRQSGRLEAVAPCRRRRLSTSAR